MHLFLFWIIMSNNDIWRLVEKWGKNEEMREIKNGEKLLKKATRKKKGKWKIATAMRNDEKSSYAFFAKEAAPLHTESHYKEEVHRTATCWPETGDQD